MDAKTKAVINELAHQRNQYMDAVAQLSGEVAERDAKIAELQEQVQARADAGVTAVDAT